MSQDFKTDLATYINAQTLTNRRKQTRYMNLLFLLSLVSFCAALLGLFLIWRNEDSVTLQTGGDVSVREAEEILLRANEATDYANNVLNFIEGVSFFVSVGVAAIALIVRNDIRQQINEIKEEVALTLDYMSKQFGEREVRLTALEQDIRRELQEAVESNQRRFDEVQSSARDSFRVVSLQLLAEQQVRAHNIETAIKTIKTAFEMDPEDPASNYLLGYLYTSRQQIDQALEHFERALEHDPDFAPAIAAYGLALRRKGDRINNPERIAERNRYWAQAEDKLLQALEMDASLTDADGESYYGTIAGLYRRQGRYRDAVEVYERAYAVTPYSSYPVINLASLHKHQGNDEQAEYFFKLVIDRAQLTLDDDPRDVWTRTDLATAKLVVGDIDQALEELRIVIQQNPGSGVLETMRSSLEFLKGSPRSIEGLDEMIQMIDLALEKLRTQEIDRRETEEPGTVRATDKT